MTTKDEIFEWLMVGRDKGYSHMMVVTDTYDWDDYPVYVKEGEINDKVKEFDGNNMQRITEIYNYKMNLMKQLHEFRANHIETEGEDVQETKKLA